jgi:hypothetical protein
MKQDQKSDSKKTPSVKTPTGTPRTPSVKKGGLEKFELFQKLDADLKYNVIQMLNFDSLLNVSRVSKDISNRLNTDDAFWKNIFERDFPQLSNKVDNFDGLMSYPMEIDYTNYHGYIGDTTSYDIMEQELVQKKNWNKGMHFFFCLIYSIFVGLNTKKIVVKNRNYSFFLYSDIC